MSVKTINLSEEFGVWFINFLAFLKTKGKELGGGGQGHPWIPLILTPLHYPVPGFQIVGTAQRYVSRTKNSEAYIIIIIIIIIVISFTFIFSLFCCKAA